MRRLALLCRAHMIGTQEDSLGISHAGNSNLPAAGCNSHTREKKLMPSTRHYV